MLQKVKNTIKEIGTMSVAFTLALVVFIGFSIASAWTEPAVAPPGGNVGAPINVGASGQIKSGGLQVNGFVNTGGTQLNSVANCSGKLITNAAGVVSCGVDQVGGGIDTSTFLNTSATAQNKAGSIGASSFCDQNGMNCKTIASLVSDTSGFINTSATAQTKAGQLQVNGFRNVGGTVLDGNVGVGTISPTAKLHVVGGGIYANGATSGYGVYANAGDIGTTQKFRSNQYCDANGLNCKAVTAMGGMSSSYQSISNGGCRIANPFTGGCSCPAGTTARLMFQAYLHGFWDSIYENMYGCF